MVRTRIQKYLVLNFLVNIWKFRKNIEKIKEMKYCYDEGKFRLKVLIFWKQNWTCTNLEELDPSVQHHLTAMPLAMATLWLSMKLHDPADESLANTPTIFVFLFYQIKLKKKILPLNIQLYVRKHLLIGFHLISHQTYPMDTRPTFQPPPFVRRDFLPALFHVIWLIAVKPETK